LAQVGWFCAALAESTPGLRCTCDPKAWDVAGGLLLWEAFVSGKGKPDRLIKSLVPADTSQHLADAAAATSEFIRLSSDGRWTQTEPAVTTGDHRPLNLLATAALAAKLSIRAEELTEPVFVVKTVAPL
jgi:hypothetical protein